MRYSQCLQNVEKNNEIESMVIECGKEL